MKPTIKKLHFLSDGPTSQYRCKFMFSLLTDLIRKNFIQIKYIVYNFSESGHGKNAADGVGAVTKRTADGVVACGKDVSNFESLVQALEESQINVWFAPVTAKEILQADKGMKKNLPTFKGTMKMHQWIWCKNKPSIIRFNRLSCYDCNLDTHCNHFHLGEISYSETEEKSEKKRKRL